MTGYMSTNNVANATITLSNSANDPTGTINNTSFYVP